MKLDLDAILEDFSKEINGQIIPYDDDHSVIMIPVKNGRFQRVVGWVVRTETYKYLEFLSRICPINDTIDYNELLSKASKYCTARIIIRDGYLQVASGIVVEHATVEIIKDMVLEAANVADELEQVYSSVDKY